MDGTTKTSEPGIVEQATPQANPQPGSPDDSIVRGFVSEALDHGAYYIQVAWLDHTKPPSARLQSRVMWHDFPIGDLPTVLRLAREKIARETRRVSSEFEETESPANVPPLPAVESPAIEPTEGEL